MVGEETGNLSEVMERLSERYREEAERRLQDRGADDELRDLRARRAHDHLRHLQHREPVSGHAGRSGWWIVGRGFRDSQIRAGESFVTAALSSRSSCSYIPPAAPDTAAPPPPRRTVPTASSRRACRAPRCRSFRFSVTVSTIARLGGSVCLKPASDSRCVNRITVRGRWWQSTIIWFTSFVRTFRMSARSE